MSEKDSPEISKKDTLKDIYEYMVFDEILYNFVIQKDVVVVKGGSLKPFAVHIKNLDNDDPIRKLLIEIIKRYYEIPDDLSDKETLDYISQNEHAHPHHIQLRDTVLLAYRRDLGKHLTGYDKSKNENQTNEKNGFLKYLLIGLAIAVAIIIIAFLLTKK